MEKGKKAQAVNMNEIFLVALFLVSMLVLVDFKIIGMQLNIFLLFILAITYICYRMIFVRSVAPFPIRPQQMVDLIVLILLGWNMLSMVVKLFQDLTLGVIDYQFEVTCIVFSLLYFLAKENIELHDWCFDLIIYSGLLVIIAMLLYYLCDVQTTGILTEIMSDSGKCASYLLLPCTACVFRYNTCRDQRSSLFYLLTAAMGFFTLLINHNIISLWLMAIVFFAAPVLMKPTAEFVKRDTQIGFLFFFMMSNMGVLTNYTQLIQKEIDISLDLSLYLDFLIVAGGVFFYIYWSMIPESVNRDKLVMNNLRRGYASVLLMIGIVFLGFVTGGDRWKELPDKKGTDMVKSFAVPLIDEIKNSKNAWIYCMEQSSMYILIILVLTTLLAARIVKNHSSDKPLAGSFVIISLMIFIETFFLVPSSNIMPIYLLILVMAAFYKENKQQVASHKSNGPMEMTDR